MTKYGYEFVIFREGWYVLLTSKENEDYHQKLRGFWTTFLLIKRLDSPFKNAFGVNRRKNSSHLYCQVINEQRIFVKLQVKNIFQTINNYFELHLNVLTRVPILNTRLGTLD